VSAASKPDLDLAGAQPAGRSRTRDQRLLVIAAILAYLSMGSYVAVLPGYVLHHLHHSSVVVGVAMGMAAVAAVILRPMAGGFGDRHGRMLPGTLGAVVLALAGAVLLGPGAIVVVVASRLLLGAGDALFMTAAMAWSVDISTEERRGRAMAAFGMALWLGLALGPQWAAFARQHWGYDSVWIGAFVAPMFSALVLRLIPAPSPMAAARNDTPIAHWPLTKLRRPRFHVPAGSGLPAIAMFLAVYGQGIFEAFGVVHLTARGVPSGGGFGGAASVFTVLAVVTFSMRFVGGAVADRVDPRRMAVTAVVLLSLSYGVFALAGSFALAAVSATLMGVGLALLYTSLGVLVSRRVAPHERGAGLGVYLSALDLAFGLGPMLGGLTVAAASTATAMWSGAALALVAVPVVIATGAAVKRGGQEGPEALAM
jgi:MFS family permease